VELAAAAAAPGAVAGVAPAAHRLKRFRRVMHVASYLSIKPHLVAFPQVDLPKRSGPDVLAQPCRAPVLLCTRRCSRGNMQSDDGKLITMLLTPRQLLMYP